MRYFVQQISVMRLSGSERMPIMILNDSDAFTTSFSFIRRQRVHTFRHNSSLYRKAMSWSVSTSKTSEGITNLRILRGQDHAAGIPVNPGWDLIQQSETELGRR